MLEYNRPQVQRKRSRSGGGRRREREQNRSRDLAWHEKEVACHETNEDEIAEATETYSVRQIQSSLSDVSADSRKRKTDDDRSPVSNSEAEDDRNRVSNSGADDDISVCGDSVVSSVCESESRKGVQPLVESHGESRSPGESSKYNAEQEVGNAGFFFLNLGARGGVVNNINVILRCSAQVIILVEATKSVEEALT